MQRKILILFLGAFVFRMILAFVAWHPDLNNHVDWGIRFWQYGPGDFYQQNVWSFTWPNQPPGTIIIFALIRKLFEGIFNFFWWINVTLPVFPSNIMLFFEERLYQALLKLPAILADLGIAYLIWRFFKLQGGEKLGILGASFFLFNPVVWYNSSIWGQTDATVNFFGLLAFILLLGRKLTFAFLCLAVSLFIKASLLILVPIFIIIAWRQIYHRQEWVKAILISLLVVGLLTLPFARGEPFSWLVNLYQQKVFGWQLHVITANAFNFWAAITGIHERPDILLFGSLSFQKWGYILFGVSIIPLFLKIYKNQNSLNIIWVLALTFFSSFMLLTGMHERYLYPLFPFLTILAVREKRLMWLLILVSGIHLLNLYNFWWYPRIEVIVNMLSLGDRLMPRILGGVMFLIFVWVYLYFFKHGRKQKL